MARPIKGSFYLTGLKHIKEVRKNSKGEQVECMVIPIVQNNLFVTDKGSVIVNFAAWPKSGTANVKFTHNLKQSLDKDDAEKLKAAGLYPADLGNLTLSSDESDPTPSAPADISAPISPADCPF